MRPNPKTHHLDKRAEQIIAESTGAGDDLLTPEQLADWLSVSLEWLDQARAHGYGPRVTKFSHKHIRYKRGDVVRWLRERTNHYARSPSAKRKNKPIGTGRAPQMVAAR